MAAQPFARLPAPTAGPKVGRAACAAGSRQVRERACDGAVRVCEKCMHTAGAEATGALPPVRNLIRENRAFEIPNVIDTNRQLGMISLDNAIAELFYNGMISREDAIAQSANPDKLERMIAA